MQPANRIIAPRSRSIRTVLLLAIALLLLLSLFQPAGAARDVKVALTELKPSLFTNEQGEPDGFFVDIVEDVAQSEGWNVIWVSGSISRSWERLSTGEIDLMPAVSRTPEREVLYDFGNESALSVWSQVYARPGSGINTILDLDGRTVAMVRGASSGSGLKDYAKRFDVNATYLEKDTPAEIFSAVASRDADALVVYNTAGDADAKTYGLTATPVMFNPVQMSFAVRNGKNTDLLAALDRGIAEGKRSPSSPYNRAMQKWYGIEAGSTIPPWLFWGLAGAAGIAILFVAMSYVLRREVRRKTAELSRQNEELQAEIRTRTRTEIELKQKNEELNAAYEEMQATGEELRRNYDELAENQRALTQARKKLSQLNTLAFQDLRNGFFSLSGYLQLARKTDSGQDSATLLAKGEDLLYRIERSMNVAKKYQDLGINPPRWQDVNLVLISALSHLDTSRVSRKTALGRLEIFADPLLEDVFVTLMENVLIHGGGSREVRISSRNEGRGITILFEDDGPGIPAAEKERIFERDYPRKAGMGLYLVREILAITGITIRETGEPGKGARFEIMVPEGQYHIGAGEV